VVGGAGRNRRRGAGRDRSARCPPRAILYRFSLASGDFESPSKPPLAPETEAAARILAMTTRALEVWGATRDDDPWTRADDA
jgi:hypothetical protein